jgi:hypothetical protein
MIGGDLAGAREVWWDSKIAGEVIERPAGHDA